MRPYGTPQPLERRRRHAVELLAPRLTLSEVARRVQASVSSVAQWQQTWRTGGEAALAPPAVPGRPRKLPDQPRAQWLQLLRQGACTHGFPDEMWTLRRMAAMMQVPFGVRYRPSHVWKVLRRLGWSGQVPERRAIQRNEQAMAHWQRDTWPATKKSPPPGGPLVFLDESGFLLIPTHRRTWAPEGHTPMVPHRYRHDRLSALAALTVLPKR